MIDYINHKYDRTSTTGVIVEKVIVKAQVVVDD